MPTINPPLSAESQKVNDFVNDATVQQTLDYLYSRWQDEKEYENINDYAKPLNLHFQRHGLTLEKMTKRPFGCIVVINGKRYQVDVNSRGMGWRTAK